MKSVSQRFEGDTTGSEGEGVAIQHKGFFPIIQSALLAFLFCVEEVIVKIVREFLAFVILLSIYACNKIIGLKFSMTTYFVSKALALF